MSITYQLKEKAETKTLQESKDIDDVFENLADYNPTKKRKVLIMFNNMIADMEANKNVSPIVTELFLGGRKLNISLVITITMLQNHNHIP